MSVQFKQLSDGSLGLQGDLTGGNGEFIPLVVNYIASSAATQAIFTASRNYVVQSIIGRTQVAGTGGACTMSIYSVPSGTAVASGTLLHSGTFNLVGTINTNQTLTLSTTASALAIPAGNSIGIVITGTATSAVGSVTIALSPAN